MRPTLEKNGWLHYSRMCSSTHPSVIVDIIFIINYITNIFLKIIKGFTLLKIIHYMTSYKKNFLITFALPLTPHCQNILTLPPSVSLWLTYPPNLVTI